MGSLAKEKGMPLAVKGGNIDELISLSDQLTGMGVKDLVLDPGSREMKSWKLLSDIILITFPALRK